MTITKEEVLEMVSQLPDEIDVEELVYRLYRRETLGQAEADVAGGRLLSAKEIWNRVEDGVRHHGRVSFG